MHGIKMYFTQVTNSLKFYWNKHYNYFFKDSRLREAVHNVILNLNPYDFEVRITKVISIVFKSSVTQFLSRKSTAKNIFQSLQTPFQFVFEFLLIFFPSQAKRSSNAKDQFITFTTSISIFLPVQYPLGFNLCILNFKKVYLVCKRTQIMLWKFISGAHAF